MKKLIKKIINKHGYTLLSCSLHLATMMYAMLLIYGAYSAFTG